MNCTSCGAPLPPRTHRCDFCGTLNDVDLRTLQESYARGPQSDRDCPRCGERMVGLGLSGGERPVFVERCERCLGIFFDPGELENVLDAADRAAMPPDADVERLDALVEETAQADRVEYVRCPVCGTLMNRRAYGARSGVVVDTCKGHGIWLDGGELGRLIRWRRAGGPHLDAAVKVEEARLKERRSGGIDVLALRSPEFRRGATTGVENGGNLIDAFAILRDILGSWRR